MQSNWRIGSLFGIPFFIDPSWFFILALVTLLKAGNFDPSFQSISAWSLGLVMALLLFASVLLHELGHSLVARSQGIKVNSITLFIFGGVASIDRESQTPGDAFQVAIAGPGVSLCLFGLFYGLTQVLPTDNLGYVVAADLARINLVLTLFNLIPGLPLDGGQVLKAAIWKLTGNRLQGVRWAAQGGKVIGSLAIAVSVGLTLLTGVWTILWLALIGSFVYRNANAYDRLTILQEALLQLQASDAMTRDFRVLDATMSLRSFADEYILADIQTNKPYYAASEGRYRGLVKIQDLQTIERSRWEMESLESLVHPLSEIATVEEKTPLIDVINTLETCQLKHLTVLSPAGAIAGVIDRGDIVQAVAGRLNLPISQEQIQQIKAEGSYPSWLKLSAIAKATTS
ncbi:MAG: site-2 protease family protein [Coleofasciculus sp. A1-SPW-01]|uniref:site-2 protease family protein n=1 Tax=Coleofasciculus TaxID=669368 RepID=UPI0005C4C7E5|nr:site-2 protease family protein [Coleofasciculus chthonoplastes]